MAPLNVTKAQAETNEKFKYELTNKRQVAYVLFVDILDESEQSVGYQVHYNTRKPLALDFKQWCLPHVDSDHDRSILQHVKEFMQNMVFEIMDEMGESEVLVKSIMLTVDGAYE